MAPKSNLGKLDAIFSAVLALVCIGAGYVVFAATGTLNRYTKELGGPAVNEPPAVLVPVQFKNPKDLGVGKLLVASPNLADPNFAKTVILLIHSDDHGIVGLILNRRTNLALSQVLEDLPGTKDRSDTAYLGGPVEVPAVIALLQSKDKVEGADLIFSGVYLISKKALLEHTLAARPDPQVFHVYLGYAGWSSDQLRKEVELGAWFIFPPDQGVVFNSDPASLWPQMIRKTEQKLAGNVAPGSESWTNAGSNVPYRR